MAGKDLKLAIGWNRINLEILGIWPEPLSTENPFTSYRFVIPAFLMSAFIFVPQTLALYLVRDDVTACCEILSTAWIPVTNAFAKLLAVRYHRKVLVTNIPNYELIKLNKANLPEALRLLIQSFYNDWSQSCSQKQHEIMLDGAKRAKKISIWCTIITQTMVTLFIAMRTIQILSTNRDNGDQLHHLIYPGHVPYSIKSAPILFLTNTAQVMSAYCATISYTGVDSFLCMLVIHACAQFSTLELRLASLFDSATLVRPAEAFREELGAIIRRHEHLVWYAGTLEECFSVFMLFQLMLCTLQICLQAFKALAIFESGTGNFLIYLFYAFLIAFVVTHIYLYCYMGEMLLGQNSKFAESAYNAQWYTNRTSEAKSVLFIMCRSAIPLRLTAGKFGTFSMEMFSTILRTAMGYLSVLLTVDNYSD